MLQKRLIRIITSSPYRAHTSPLYKKLCLLNLNNIHEYVTATFMYNFKNGNLPNIFLSMFESNAVYHQHETRQRHDFHLPMCKTHHTKSTTRYYGAKICNSIPDNIRNCNTVSSFKYLFKNLILSRNIE